MAWVGRGRTRAWGTGGVSSRTVSSGGQFCKRLRFNKDCSARRRRSLLHNTHIPFPPEGRCYVSSFYYVCWNRCLNTNTFVLFYDQQKIFTIDIFRSNSTYVVKLLVFRVLIFHIHEFRDYSAYTTALCGMWLYRAAVSCGCIMCLYRVAVSCTSCFSKSDPLEVTSNDSILRQKKREMRK